MSGDEIGWSTRAQVVEALTARLSSAENHDEAFQRALAAAAQIGDRETLAALYRSYLDAATAEVADLLRLACAMRGAPLEDAERRSAIRDAARRIDDGLVRPTLERRWNNVAGRTCVYLLAGYSPATIVEILADELGSRDSSFYGSLWVSASAHRPGDRSIGDALLHSWAAAPHKSKANDLAVRIAHYRRNPQADHCRLRALYPALKLLPLPRDGLQPDEVRALFAEREKERDLILERIETQRQKRAEKRPPVARQVKGRRATLARAAASAMDGDEAAIATLVELAGHESRHVRAPALRALVRCGAGRAVYRENARSAEDYHDVRLALHGLARSDDPADHDLLLASVLNRDDGITHLACLAVLAGVTPLDPDAYVDSIDEPYRGPRTIEPAT